MLESNPLKSRILVRRLAAPPAKAYLEAEYATFNTTVLPKETELVVNRRGQGSLQTPGRAGWRTAVRIQNATAVSFQMLDGPGVCFSMLLHSNGASTLIYDLLKM